VRACGCAIILPPVFVTLGMEKLSARRMRRRSGSSAVSGRFTVLFALKMKAAHAAGRGRAGENHTARVADAINRLPLDYSAVRGLLVEIESPARQRSC